MPDPMFFGLAQGGSSSDFLLLWLLIYFFPSGLMLFHCVRIVSSLAVQILMVNRVLSAT